LSQEAIGNAAVVLSAGREAMLAEGARGLSACPVGAFYDDEAAALIGVDRQRQWVLHFAALGVPAESGGG